MLAGINHLNPLYGVWETSNEGGFQAMMGTRLMLLRSGQGTMHSWGHGMSEPYYYEEQLLWEQINEETLQIRRVEDRDFTIVHFKLVSYIGPYGDKFLKLFEPGFKLGSTDLDGFWTIPGALFKRVD